MPTNAKTKVRRAAQRKSRSGAPPDSAIALLKQDHREVEEFFEEYEELEDDNAKAELAEKICLALEGPHPDRGGNFLPRRTESHGGRRPSRRGAGRARRGKEHLIGEIEAMEVGDNLYDAKITVLGEQIKHHVKEEEERTLPGNRRIQNGCGRDRASNWRRASPKRLWPQSGMMAEAK